MFNKGLRKKYCDFIFQKATELSDIGEENGIIEFGSNEAVLTVIAWIGHSIMMDKSDFKLARGVIKDAVNNFSKAKQCSPEYRQQYFVFVEDVFNKIHEFGEKESQKYREDPSTQFLFHYPRSRGGSNPARPGCGCR